MIRVLFIISAAFVISSCASTNPDPDQMELNPESAALSENVELAENVEPADEEEMICNVERITGTRIKTKTCLTKAQHERAKRDSRAFVDKLKMTPEPRIDGG